MTSNRIVAGTLSLVLLALITWCTFTGFGDIRTRTLLSVGAALGLLYTALGRLPERIVNITDGFITDDDDPSNISPRIYLPILLGAIVIAAALIVIWIL